MAKQQDSRIRKIIILGAGTIGRYIAELLQREEVDVVLIDISRDAIEQVSESLDIQTVYGNGASPEVLERAGIRESQLLLALTNSCEVNMLAAFIAKQMGVSKTVVRTRAAWSMDTSKVDLRSSLNIDLLLNPELLTAIEMVKFLENPDALAMTHFARGRVQLRQFTLDSKSAFAGKALKDCDIPPGVLVVMRSRQNEVVIPQGNTVLEEGDKVSIVGLPNVLAEAQKLFHAPSEALRRVVIAGGGNSGRFLAQTMEERSFNIKLIEPDAERCEYLSERLQRATVIRGDATEMGFLKEERIGDADVFVGVMGDDEDNMMACLLAKDLGAKQTIARIQRPDYASLVQKMGIDMALSPRHVMANNVMTMISGGRIQSVSLMEEGKVEVIEFVAAVNTQVVDKPLAELDMPEGALISSIVRRNKVIVPGGHEVICPGDIVIVVGLCESMDEVERLFESKQ
ncbi:MAG: Trk system potassium transporter TrkA [Candidatus Sumerlaeia bacterium]